MLLGETIGVALGALRANKLRSFLTMLGVVIGVGAVITVVALGRGAQQSVNARISALGTTLLTVQPGQIFAPGGVSSGNDRAPMTVHSPADRSVRLTKRDAHGDLHAILQCQSPLARLAFT